MSNGKLIVISGPSGVGKGTIVRKLLAMDDNLTVSISATTRPKRNGEVDGKDYIFMTKEEFEMNIASNSFAEYAVYAGNYYGTLLSTINKIIKSGKILILEIDVQGAMQIRKNFPDAKLIFITPPDIDELKRRLLGRNTDSLEVIEKRMAQVERELIYAEKFDNKVTNDNLEVATLAVLEIIYG